MESRLNIFLLPHLDPWLGDVTELGRLHGLAWIEAMELCNEAFEGQRYWCLIISLFVVKD